MKNTPLAVYIRSLEKEERLDAILEIARQTHSSVHTVNGWIYRGCPDPLRRKIISDIVGIEEEKLKP